MKITIKCENENEKEVDLTLADEYMDNDNFVTLIIDDEMEYTVSVSDLHCAILSFYSKREGRLRMEKLMSKE